MTEVQRRKVTVHNSDSKFAVNTADGLLTIQVVSQEPLVFGLFSGESLIAESHSDHSLSTWAFSHVGVHNIRYDYDLRLGDDAR